MARKDPHAVAMMRCTHVARSETVPLRIVPEYGKISEDSAKPASSEIWRVFHVHEPWSNLIDHAGKLSPEPRLGAVLDAAPAPWCRDVLAWEAARYEIHKSTPGAPVEGLDVVPDRKRWQESVELSLHEHASAKGVDLDGADGSVSEQESAKYPAASSGE